MEIGKLKLHDQIKTIDQLYFFTSTTQVLWLLVRFPLRWPISRPQGPFFHSGITGISFAELALHNRCDE